MIAGFDHVRLTAQNVGAAVQAYHTAFGVAPVWRGSAASFQLANIALRIDAARPGEPEGLSGVTFAVTDLAEARRQVERRGIPCETPDDEGAVRLAPAGTYGVSLGLTAAPSPSSDAVTPGADALGALDHVVIVTPNPDRALALYGARLGLDLRLERSNPAWNARLFFFRCGDAVVEISADPKASSAYGPDRLSGLAWRARNPLAARQRIAKTGLDVSEVRAGRKAGTDVFTLRAGLVGAPALVIGPSASAT